MTSETLKILNDNAGSFIDQVKSNLGTSGTSATGKTSDSLRYEITEEGTKIVLTVFGRPYFATVETGRKAGGGISRAMIENITAWVSARGIPESAVWGIATKIQKEGTELFRKGGRTDIYSDLKEGFADKIFQEVTESIANEYFRNATVAFA